MMFCAGLLLIVAAAVNSYSGNPVNKFYLGIGIAFVLFGALMFWVKRGKPSAKGEGV